MDRNPHLAAWSRDCDWAGTEHPVRHGCFRKVALAEDVELSFDGGRAYYTYERDAVLAHLLIRGEVPEIPDIENLADTGWIFRHVNHRRGRYACSSTITFEIPEGGEEYTERLLLYYCLLYGA